MKRSYRVYAINKLSGARFFLARYGSRKGAKSYLKIVKRRNSGQNRYWYTIRVRWSVKRTRGEEIA